MSRKANSLGQSAIELLTTYGWAVLIVMVSLSVMVTLGVFANPLPSSCAFPSDLSCRTYLLNTSGKLGLEVGQSSDHALRVVALRCTQESNAVLNAGDVLAIPVVIPRGGSVVITNGTQNCLVMQNGVAVPFNGSKGSMYKGKVYIEYQEMDTGTRHVVVGNVQLKSEEVMLPTPYRTPSPSTCGSCQYCAPGHGTCGSCETGFCASSACGAASSCGSACSGSSVCNGAGSCTGKGAIGAACLCDGQCTSGACAGGTCAQCTSDAQCTGATPRCFGSVCVQCTQATQAQDCNDNNACTTDSCDAFHVCQHVNGCTPTPAPTPGPTPSPTAAPTPGPTPSPTPSAKGWMYGLVVSTNGTGISGALVSIVNASGSPGNSSNASGGYSVYNVSAGTFSVKVNKSGFVDNVTAVTITAGAGTNRSFILASVPTPSPTPSATVISGCPTNISSKAAYSLSSDLTYNSSGKNACIQFNAGSAGSTLNCAGHSIAGNCTGIGCDSGIGVRIYAADNVTVTNCVIHGFRTGVYAGEPTTYPTNDHNFTIASNTLTSNAEGINGFSLTSIYAGNDLSNNFATGIILTGNNNTVINNIARYDRYYGILIQGGTDNNAVTGNTACNSGPDLYGVYHDIECPAGSTNLHGSGNTCTNLSCTGVTCSSICP